MGEFQLLNRKEIDEKRWNEAVKACSNFRHYYLSYFLDSTTDWSAIVVDDYKVIWPLPIKTRMIQWVYQPLLAQQLGPISSNEISLELLRALWKFLQKRFWYINVKFNSHIENVPQRSGEFINLELSLKATIEEVRKKYNRSQSSNMKKGKQAGVEIRSNEANVADIIQMFKKGKGQEIRILDDKFYSDVLKIFDTFKQRGEAEQWGAYLQGQLCAGALILKSEGRALNFFTSVSEKARQCGAMHNMFDTIIQSHIGSSAILDFEGSNDPNLAFFYKGIGGVEKVYLQATSRWFPPFLRR